MKTSKRQKKAISALNLDLFQPKSLAPPAPVTLHTAITESGPGATEGVAKMADERPGGKADRLPSIGELYYRFERFNWLYFQGKLPKTRVEYSNRMTSAGVYIPAHKLIRIGRKYHEIFPDDIDDTLKHEMIHLIHFRHNAAFKAEAKRVGASLKAKPHPSLRRPPKYVYVCDNCGLEYPRQKRLVMASCGKCSKGRRFDVRFKLRLLTSRKQKKTTAAK